jgi:hypothetical protein
MTVGEWCKKLEDIDPQTKVVVRWEVDSEPTYFAVSGLSLREATPSRVDGVAEFTFGRDGSTAWLFIEERKLDLSVRTPYC